MEKLLVWICVGIKIDKISIKVFSSFESAKLFKQYHKKDYDRFKIIQTEVA